MQESSREMERVSFGMKPTFQFSKELIENQNAFQGRFYQRFQLRHSRQPLKLDQQISKDYLFPTFYGEVTSSIAMFFCSHKKALKKMPDSSLKPLSMGSGRSLVIISSYHYGKVLGIPPYNEIAISIPTLYKPKINLPVLPLVADPFQRLGYYVLSMPVTSLENQIRGHQIWGLPKVLQEINLKIEDGNMVTTAKEESGEVYLRLSVPIHGEKKAIDQTVHLYSKLGNHIVKSRSDTYGLFTVSKFHRTLFQKTLHPTHPFLELGSTQSGADLQELEIEENPFEVRYGNGIMSTFDLPDTKFARE